MRGEYFYRSFPLLISPAEARKAKNNFFFPGIVFFFFDCGWAENSDRKKKNFLMFLTLEFFYLSSILDALRMMRLQNIFESID